MPPTNTDQHDRLRVGGMTEEQAQIGSPDRFVNQPRGAQHDEQRGEHGDGKQSVAIHLFGLAETGGVTSGGRGPEGGTGDAAAVKKKGGSIARPAPFRCVLDYTPVRHDASRQALLSHPRSRDPCDRAWPAGADGVSVSVGPRCRRWSSLNVLVGDVMTPRRSLNHHAGDVVASDVAASMPASALPDRPGAVRAVELGDRRLGAVASAAGLPTPWPGWCIPRTAGWRWPPGYR